MSTVNTAVTLSDTITGKMPSNLVLAIENLVSQNQYQLQTTFLSAHPAELEILALVPPGTNHPFLETSLKYLNYLIRNKVPTKLLKNSHDSNQNIRAVSANIKMEDGLIYVNHKSSKQTVKLNSSEFSTCFQSHLVN